MALHLKHRITPTQPPDPDHSALECDTDGDAVLVAFGGAVTPVGISAAERSKLSSLPSSVDPAGTANTVVTAHVGAADPHGDRAYADTRLSNLIGAAPAGFDTLVEIATQLSNDESAAAALTTTVAGKLAKSANLSDLPDAAAARSNLGLGTAATTAATAYATSGHTHTPASLGASAVGHTHTPAEAGAEPAGTTASAITTHSAAADPHGDRAFATTGLAGKAPLGYIVLANGTLAMAHATNNTVKVTPTATGTYTTTVPPAGTRCTLIILTAGVVTFTITFGSGFKPTATLATGTTAARVFVISWISDGTNLYEASRTVAMVA